MSDPRATRPAGAAPRVVWRCFPWDEEATPGAPFTAAHITRGQTVGRFDLGDRPPVRYLAESAEHAIGEVLSPFRGTTFTPAYLVQQRRPLALVEASLAPALLERVADCTEPHTLSALAVRPDALAHHDRTVTQALARQIYDRAPIDAPPYAGLRWWSALTGAWHTIVLFTDREREGELRFDTPRVLRLEDAELRAALTALGIRV